MSFNSTSPSAIRPCDGGKKSLDTEDEQNESGNLKLAYVAETKQALRPASFQLFTQFPSKVGSELASAVADRPMALQPNGLSAIVVADDFSQSTVCLRPEGSEAIAQAATLRSLPKSVAARSSGDRDRNSSEYVSGQGKNTAASGLVVDQCGSRLNPDALEFKFKSQSSMQVDTREGVGLTPSSSYDICGLYGLIKEEGC